MKRRLLLLEVLVVLFLNLSSQPLAYDGSAAYDWGDSVPNYNPLAVIMFGSLETSNLTFGDFMGLSPTQPDATSYGDMGVGVGWDDNVVENAGDANTNGDALDGLYVQFYFPDGGWWDLGAETNRIAVFLSQDHGPYLAEGLEVQVYGSNELWGSAGSQALLTDVYLDGWRPHHSEEDANGNGWCSDDIAAVFELLGQYRYIKLTGWDPSLFWDLNEPEVDAVAALSPCVNAPSGLNAQSISLDTIRLNWTDNSSDENGFRVYRDGSFSKELPANTVSNDDTGLAAGTDYCYVVTAFNNACGESIPSNEDCASTCSPPGVPVSINYPSSDSDGSYTISWAAVTGVTRYELERSSDGGITWTPIYSGPNLTYPETVSCGVYRYRVRACNSCGCGEWRTGSTDCNYTAPPAPANISYPTNDSDGTYTVSWSSAVRATRYELERSSDGGVTWTPIYSGPSASYSDTVSCGIYRYRVRACNSCGCGEWRTGSTDCNYTAPPAPASISYSTNDSDGTYTVSWSSAVRATRYELERSSDGGVTWTPIYSGPSASYSDTVSCGIYRYRVRACNNCGCSDWRTGPTECNYTTPPVPASITYPTSDSDGVYTVSWASALRVARYELERSSDGGVTWTPIYSGPNTSYNESVSCGVYRYRVNASNACGTSDWRPGVDCNYTSPPVPATLTYPASDADGQFTVSWATTSRATYYLLERSKDGGPWEPVYSGPSTSYGENIPCGSYRYRIRACNSCGCGAWRTGTTDCVVDGPPAPGGIAYPATDPDGEYIVSWGVSAAAASYRLERSGDAGSTWMQVYSGASTSFGEDVCPSPGNGAYRYRVRAIDANGCPSTYRTGTGNCVVTACEVCEPPDSPAAIAYPTGDSDGIYTVSWDASTSATSYQLERSKDGGSWAPVYSGADTFFDENVCSLNGHGDYAYRVRGINDCGSSDWRTGTWVCEACYACTKTLTAAETYAAPGAKCVVVLILIDNAGGVAGADLCLTFDPDIVTVSDDGSCQPPIRTTSLTAGFSVQYNTSTPGVVCISLARANAIQSGSGAFVEALFDVNEGVAQGGQSDIDFQNVLLYDESGNEIRPRACHEAGTLWIGCHGQKGDINNDGNINSGDAILALRIAAELCIGNPCEPADECERCRGDVNCDCDNNSGDAILILRYAAGLIQQFPCGMTCCGQYQ